MLDKEIREKYDEIAKEQDLTLYFFDNHAYDKSIIGISSTGKLVYSYDKMVQEFMEDEDCDEIDAIEWIDFNTMRQLPYFGENAPIIVYNYDYYF